MDQTLERLERDLRWHLLAPPRTWAAATPNSADLVRPSELLRAVRAARFDVYGGDDGVPDEDPRSTDDAAWHLVATDAGGQVAGAMRVFVVDPRTEPLTAQDIVAFGHVAFPSPALETRHLAALEKWIERMRDQPCYIYAGGLFTTPAWRNSGLGMAFGLAAIALVRLHRTRFAGCFVAVRERGQQLFEWLGGRPLTCSAGQVLAPFHCARHRFPTQLLAFDPLLAAPQAEPALEATRVRMQTLIERTGHRLVQPAPARETTAQSP